jgi:hypothetical protein
MTKEKKPTKKWMVSLRIDRHTVIMVPPEKATPEYAEEWKAKYRAGVKIADTRETCMNNIASKGRKGSRR